MKIISVDQVSYSDLVEDDLFLDPGLGHLSKADVEMLMEQFHELRVYIKVAGSRAAIHAMPAGPDSKVTRLNVERRTWTHGLRSTYGAGCRCVTCTEAQRDYMRSYSADRRASAKEEPAEVT